MYSGKLSARGAVRVLRLAWTVADLASARLGEDIHPGKPEVEVALKLRQGEPLPSRVVRVVDQEGAVG
ncbi:magnesium chelatase subunit ChlI family protein [Nocardioides montaniterrae]